MVSIFTNLFENSIKYSELTPSIEVWTQEGPKEWIVKVADKGIGITDPEKPKVFDKFYRTGNEDTRKTKGTGLGLYIVHKIVKAHHGDIKISDNTGRGTIFTITFPKTNLI
jgi:two-component system, OmpR family, phosphate regulon sensor histidine kinase PhoR